ncbi:MAG: DUF3570 domain-containing protein [Sandaracinaceae bacterium]|nr:DUF3570 domain-containing protein [Sandaracinaceae bacterium]
MRTAAALALATLVFAAPARADTAQIDLFSTLFYEFGGPLEMLVVNPAARVRANPIPELSLNLSYEADVVSGASVAVVDAPSADVDAITSATRLDDFRSVVSGGLAVQSPVGTLRGGYAYGWESDYTSHSFNLGARTEAFERNTTFDLSYARGFDQVCNLAQPRAQDPVERRRLDVSDGCFDGNDPDRAALDVSLQTFQGSWTQAWAPIFVTQLTVTGQLIDGFQSNPYRAVWLGRSAAQEHHPDNRFRYAASLGARLWVEPLNGSIHAHVRAYRDNWDVRSITAQLSYEQSIGGALRVRGHFRYYRQGAAAFFSDDYALRPRGQYFTGDRELSDMESFMGGLSLVWALTPGTEGADLGPLSSFRLVLKADYIHNEFPSFRYARARVPNVDAIVATLGLEMIF